MQLNILLTKVLIGCKVWDFHNCNFGGVILGSIAILMTKIFIILFDL